MIFLISFLSNGQTFRLLLSLGQTKNSYYWQLSRTLVHLRLIILLYSSLQATINSAFLN